ncbi:uncharacterized protein LOC123352607 isoform X2 [Mauremys mutica]|nr:uncharacterized protein LOC123352607 isoform X2 [Mauremys mutica]XP_044848919.1 uncharacterized protein LOC123352607 isoform X2 [Mauremys mutica]XP_044848920.1 uncharacterized protein LOC123352607 isoform X2 [Mauremys mutica]
MGTVALYVLVSSVIQNCYLRSSQCSAELDGEVNTWDEGVRNIPASVTSLLQLRRGDARGEGLSAKVPLVKASEAAHTRGTSSSPHPGPSPDSGASFSSSAPGRALPAGEVSALALPLEQEGEGSGTAAPAGSAAQGPPGVIEHPSGIWGKEIPTRNRSKAYSLPAGNTTGMVRLSTQRKQESATRPPVTTARQKSPPASNWLPVLEKHDIPVVVGVSVSLALIFISMGVYSFRQKIEHAKGNSTSSQKSSNSRRRRNYLEADEAYENRAFEVECTVDAVEQNPHNTSTSPSLLHSDPTLPAEAAGHREEPLGVAAGKLLQKAQARAVELLGGSPAPVVFSAPCDVHVASYQDSPVSLQRESAHQEKPPSPHKAAPSSAPTQLKSAGPGEPAARAPGMCSATSLALQHIGTTLYFHGPEPLLQSIVPLGRNTRGNHGQVTAAPVVGMVEHSPPGDQSSAEIAMMSVTVEIHLYPCNAEVSSASAATQNVSDSSHPEAAGAASQQPASLVGPGPRSFL